MKNYNESFNYPLCPNCGNDGYEVPEIQDVGSIEEGKVITRKETCPYCGKCGKCGEYIYRQPKITIFISKYDKHTGQHQRKLCSLCMNCYTNLLDYLEVPDIQ